MSWPRILGALALTGCMVVAFSFHDHEWVVAVCVTLANVAGYAEALWRHKL